MAKRRQAKSRVRHGTRKWVMKALEAGDSVRGMLTSEIQKRAEQLSGSSIPAYSTYQALRTLVKRKVVKATRRGREFSYRLLSAGSSEPSSSAMETPSMDPSAPSLAEGVAASAAPTSGPTVHKLALGEVAIIHVTETHVETATNEHGKLLIERHKRPSA
jgi:hypothetical protein